MPRKYSINVEHDQVVSVEVNGVRYDSPDEIEDPEDRSRMLLMVESFQDLDIDDFNLPESRPTNLPKILIPIFLGVALLMIAIAGISSVNVVRRITSEVTAPGHVVDLIERRDNEGNVFYYPVVEFYLPDQSIQTFEVSEGSWPPAYKRGDAVTVAYEPDRPQNVRILSGNSSSGLWIVPFVTCFLGVAFTLATALAVWMYVSDRRKVALIEQRSGSVFKT